jgi:hypothetical protein
MECSGTAVMTPLDGFPTQNKVRSLDACPDEDFNESAKTEIARLQLTDHLAGREIACAKCRLVRPMHAYYRCRWCGVWYCLTCAGVHFGPDSTHSP